MFGIQDMSDELKCCQHLLNELIDPKNIYCSYTFLQYVGDDYYDAEGLPHLDLKTIHDKLLKGKYLNRFEMVADVQLMLEKCSREDESRIGLTGLFEKEYTRVFGEEVTPNWASSDLKFYLFERVLALTPERLLTVSKILEENGEPSSSRDYEVIVDKLPIPTLYKLKAYIDSLPDKDFHNEKYFEEHRVKYSHPSIIMSKSEKTALSLKIDQLNDENKRKMFQLIKRYEPTSRVVKTGNLSDYLAHVRYPNIWKIKGYAEWLYEEEDNKPMTEEEKARLLDRILHMDTENKKLICTLVNEHEPAIPNCLNEVFYLFSSLQNTSLRAIERFVNNMK